MRLILEYNVGYFNSFRGVKETLIIDNKSLKYDMERNRNTFDLLFEEENNNLTLDYPISNISDNQILEIVNELRDIKSKQDCNALDGDSLYATFIDESNDIEEEIYIIPCVCPKSYFKKLKGLINKLIPTGYPEPGFIEKLGRSYQD